MARVVADGHTPFIARIDIEGREDGLFSQATDWLRQFPPDHRRVARLDAAGRRQFVELPEIDRR